MKIANKTVNYSVYVRENGKSSKINDTTGVQLPSIEFLTDTIKGAGIMGEVDLPSFNQIGAMSTEISIRVSNEEMGLLASANELEIRWVTDVFDTQNIKVGILAHKAFMNGAIKKIDEGKIESSAAQEGAFEYEVYSYKRVINGKEILNIDKFNGIYAVNGKNLLQDVESAL